ncbi:hypothetical protein TNCT_144551 [Trichonephila clavata]|uniref:Uncharacterized protein n=1 Tax=Trichonephila clavata TaxID=2740835 RepID=A0A8X6K877_TRICU|nr:hypothetical protein TNCT_144551 [Trichonephila clavata]
MSELRALDEKIKNYVPESEFENEITSSQEYQEKIVTVQGKIQRLLNRKLNSERRSETDNNEIKEIVIVKSSENRAMNLPRLQIETFYEELMDFLKREVNYREAASLVNKNNQRQEFPKQESRVEDIILITEINLLVQRLHYQQ